MENARTWIGGFGLVLLGGAALGCADDAEPNGAGGAGGSAAAGGDAQGGGGADTEPRGTLGIAECASEFRDSDGVCRPRLSDCAPGTMPVIAEGCHPIGPAACAPELMVDGLCRPAQDHCPVGERLVPSLGCLASMACGTDPFGDLADGASDIFIDANAAAAGDGSRATPFVSIAEGLAAASTGSRLRLAAGAYDEAIVLDQPIEIVGRCPNMVSIEGTVDVGGLDVAVVTEAGGAGSTLVGVHLAGAGVLAAHDLTVEDVEITDALGAGVVAVGGVVTLRRLLIEGGIPHEPTQRFGAGVQVEGGEVIVEASTMRNAALAGFTTLSPSARLTVSDSSVFGSRPSGQFTSYGTHVGSGRIELTDCLLGHNGSVGLSAAFGGTLRAVRSVVYDGADPTVAFGSFSVDDGFLEIEDSALVGFADAMVATSGMGAATLTRVWMSETQPGPTYSAGIFAEGGELTLEDVAIGPLIGAGVQLTGADASIDGLVIDGLTRDSEFEGEGVSLDEEANVTARRVALFDGAGYGLRAEASTMVVDEVIIGVGDLPVDASAGGIAFSMGSTLEARDLRVETVRLLGISAVDSVLDLERVEVRGVAATPVIEPVRGFGVLVVANKGRAAELWLKGGWVSGAETAGIGTFDAGGLIETTSVTDNTLGISFEGSLSPKLGDGNDISGNRDADEWTEGGLIVPNGGEL